MKRGRKSFAKYAAVCFSAIMFLVIALYSTAQIAYAAVDSPGDVLPAEPYGVNYTVSDAIAIPSETETGKYDATMTVRMTVNASMVKRIAGVTGELSWNKDRLSAPEVEGTYIDPDDTWLEPFYVLPEHEGTSFITSRRILMFFMNDDKGVPTAGKNGTAYYEFQLVFKGIEGELGETIENAVQFKDYFLKAGYSSCALDPINPADDPVDALTGVLTLGSIKIPGKSIIYKESVADGASSYEQILDTTEDIKNAVALGNDPDQNPSSLTMPNFTVPEGKMLAGWSTVPDDTTVIYEPGQSVGDFEDKMTLYPVWTDVIIPLSCPFTLDLNTMSITDKNGVLIVEKPGDVDGYSNYRSEGYDGEDDIDIQSILFTDNCTCDSTHKLIVKGSKPDLFLRLINDTGGETLFDVEFQGINIRRLAAGNLNEVVFKDENILGGASNGADSWPGLAVGNTSASYRIEEGANITLLTDTAGRDDFLDTTAGLKMKYLDLTMEEAVKSNTALNIAGSSRELLEGMIRIGVFDNLNGVWLQGDISVKNADERKYVRGVAENAEDEAYIDRNFSDQNIYGDTFELSTDGSGAVFGRYDKVRLQTQVQYLDIAFPIQLIDFSVATSELQTKSNYGFVSTVAVMKNDSLYFQDYIKLKSDGDTPIIKTYGEKNANVDVGYLGIVSKENRESDYQLRSYEAVKADQSIDMEAAAATPVICLEALASGQPESAVALDEQEGLKTEAGKWFSASNGRQMLELQVPKSYSDKIAADESAIPYCQKSTLLDNDSTMKLEGYHAMSISLSFDKPEI